MEDKVYLEFWISFVKVYTFINKFYTCFILCIIFNTSFSFATILYGSIHKRLSKYTISYFNSQLFNLTNILF